MEAAAANQVQIHVPQNPFNMEPRGRFIVAVDASDLLILRLVKIALMIEIDQLCSFIVIKEQAMRVEQFEGVVFRRVVRCREGDAATRTACAYVHLNGGSWQNADVDHFTPGGQQSALNRVLQHLTGGPCVAPDNDS